MALCLQAKAQGCPKAQSSCRSHELWSVPESPPDMGRVNAARRGRTSAQQPRHLAKNLTRATVSKRGLPCCTTRFSPLPGRAQEQQVSDLATSSGSCITEMAQNRLEPCQWVTPSNVPSAPTQSSSSMSPAWQKREKLGRGQLWMDTCVPGRQGKVLQR